MMKTTFSRVVALSLLVSVSVPIWAQPPDPVKPQIQTTPIFKLTDSNQYALALIGGFFDKMRRAESYRGRVATTKTILKEGKVVSTRLSTTESGWIRMADKEGEVSKSFSNLVYTVTLDGKTTVEVLNKVDDGIKEYRFYGTRNVWSERPHNANDTLIPLALARGAWLFALAGFGAGNELKIERKIVAGQDQILVGNGPGLQFIFDAKSGYLQSWILKADDEITELRWLESEFDATLPDSLFQWKTPAGSTQVAPESVKVDVQL